MPKVRRRTIRLAGHTHGKVSAQSARGSLLSLVRQGRWAGQAGAKRTGPTSPDKDPGTVLVPIQLLKCLSTI